MPARSKMLGNRTIGSEEALGVARGLEPLHAPLPLAGGLMGILGAIVEIAVLPMLDAGQDLPLGSSVTFELIRNDHARYVRW
jgi:hypothetical protein